MRVLVGYASRFGSTRDIAIRIADAVRTRGSEVDVRSVDDISDVDRYDAMVFGSGVYDGSWTTEATALMRRHAGVLARKPLWLFSVGSFGDSHPIVGGLIKKEPRRSASSSTRFIPATTASLPESSISIIGRHGDGCCSKRSAGTPATTGTGLRSMRGQSRSPARFERRSESVRGAEVLGQLRTSSSAVYLTARH